MASSSRRQSTAAAPIALCATAERKAPAPPENGRNVGMLFTFGKFTFLDLADLDWASEMALTCPVNKVGTVTIWQTDRHGNLFGAGAPAMLGAIKPQVIVVNNGPRKGLGQVDTAVQSLTRPGYQETAASYAYEKIARLPGVEGIWQGHICTGRSGAQHVERSDREFRGDRRLQGELDSSVHRARWEVHHHERPQRVQ